MEENLREIAAHFEALAAALTALRQTHSDDPDAVARLETARLRAMHGAELARAVVKGGSSPTHG